MATLPPPSRHYPLALRHVQSLCMQKEYRPCVQTCRELLRTPDVQAHPMHKAFLLFYCALAHDEMGRAMHHNSIAKVPALDNAEQSYLAALQALPSAEEAEALCAEVLQECNADESSDHDERSPSQDGFDVYEKASLISSPPSIRRDSFSECSPVQSPGFNAPDLEDLESHDSFSELMTPSRILREYSRMSLLENTPTSKRHERHMSYQGPPAPQRMQRDFSRMSLVATPPRKPMSQGLMRPIRLGSPPKPCYVPPRFANTSKLPVAGAGTQALEVITDHSPPRDSNAVAHKSFFDHQSTPEPVSPISRSETGGNYSSDASTISAISPLTPTRTRTNSVSSDDEIDQSLYLRFRDHLDSMRMQLETHITLVQQAKEQLIELRALSKVVPTTGTRALTDVTNGKANGMINQGAPASPKGLPRARSYWSFVPQDAKVAEKQRRIKAGKARNWERKTARFDPRKYQDLCERALSEL